jgi:hypothetical protein
VCLFFLRKSRITNLISTEKKKAAHPGSPRLNVNSEFGKLIFAAAAQQQADDQAKASRHADDFPWIFMDVSVGRFRGRFALGGHLVLDLFPGVAALFDALVDFVRDVFEMAGSRLADRVRFHKAPYGLIVLEQFSKWRAHTESGGTGFALTVLAFGARNSGPMKAPVEGMKMVDAAGFEPATPTV